MRLFIIFLSVLTISAIVTSMAAWGITFATAYDRVSTMASEFTDLAQGSLNVFGYFVTDLLQTNAQLVDTILAIQRRSGYNRTAQTEAEMTQTIGVLVNYSANSTQQTQRQMTAVVAAFAGLMDAVVGDFKGLAGGYAAQVRADLAVRGSIGMSQMLSVGVSTYYRIQKLGTVGYMNLSRDPTEPIGLEDCIFLDMLCTASPDLGFIPLVVATAAGRVYRCGLLEGASVSVISAGGGRYNESLLTWPPYPDSVPAASRKPMKLRCLSEPPVVAVVGQNCRLPQSCACGADPRCDPWYRQFGAPTTSYFMTRVLEGPGGIPMLNVPMSLVDTDVTPPKFMGVLYTTGDPIIFEMLISSFVGFLVDHSISSIINDTALNVIANVNLKCTGSVNVSADPNLKPWSAFRSCEPGLRAVAEWLDQNRYVAGPVSLQFNGLLWQVFPFWHPVVNYFLVLGSNLSTINQPIDASEARAAIELAAVQEQLVAEVAAAGEASQAHMAAVGAQNLAGLQLMQRNFLAEIQALENSSRAILLSSQRQSSTNVQVLADQQARQVAALKARHLDAIARGAGWSVGAVAGLLLLVLLASASGTVRVTVSLARIIGLMEDAEKMQVEDLTVPQGSSVTEVARIQAAFQGLVHRLAEYKSYIPAGLFERMELATLSQVENVDHDDVCPTPRSHTTSHTLQIPQDTEQKRHSAVLSLRSAGLPASRSTDLPAPIRAPSYSAPRGGASAQRNVAVLSVSVGGGLDAVLGPHSEPLAKGVFNEFVVSIHEAVAQSRGNIDGLLGDHVLASFNAHIPCSDPTEAAATAALEARHHLLQRLGDQLKFQIGLSFGTVRAGSVGYSKFKSMVTIGSPMQIASVLSNIGGFGDAAILADSGFEERTKYAYSMRPTELAYLPDLKRYGPKVSRSQCVFLLAGKKQLEEDEWMYQLDRGGNDWARVFRQLAAAPSLPDRQGVLEGYLAVHPEDEVALRLRDRLPRWVPGLGIPVTEETGPPMPA